MRRLPGRVGERLALRVELRDWGAVDPEDAARLVPPAEERFQCRLVWVAEAYGPSDFGALVEGLRRHGFDDGARFGRSLAEMTREGRRRMSGWAHSPLPMVRRRGEGSAFFDQVEMDMPDGVRAAVGGLFVLPGSLTVLVMCFLFDEDSASELDRAFRREYRTTGRRRKSGWTFSPPEMGQREAVSQALRDQRGALSAWVASRMPGAFGRVDASELPSAELITYRTDGALTWSSGRDWSSSLNLGWKSHAWRSETWPAIFVGEPLSSEKTPWALRMWAREQEVLSFEDEDGDRPVDTEDAWWALLQKVHRSFEGFIAMHAISSLLELYAARLADIRDLELFRGSQPRRAGKRIERAGRELEVVADVRSVASDLRQGKPPSWFFSAWDGGDWSVAEPRGEEDEERRLIADMAKYLPKRAEAVLSAEKRARERLVVEAQLVAAGAGLRLQRSAFWVAVLAFLMAVAAVAVGVIQLVT